MPPKKKKRLDLRIVELGLANTASKAEALVLSGEILVNGKLCSKAGHAVSEDADISLRSTDPKYVSRGGIKLAGALDHFQIVVQDLVCLDVGASTGGFADCLLQRGAKHVFTVDVGRGQLDPKLRNDPRVSWRESLHVRDLSPTMLNRPIDLAVVDVSFISLKKALPFVLPCLRPGGIMLSLVKPQFEAERKAVAGTGVVKDEGLRKQIIQSIVTFAQGLGFLELSTFDATIRGPKGNQETFLFGRKTIASS